MDLRILVVLAAGGCGTHAMMSGTVVMAPSQSEGHVCIADDPLVVGQVVRVMHHVCDGDQSREAANRCHAENAGTAEVTALLGQHYAAVRSIGETLIHEGDTVEAIDR